MSTAELSGLTAVVTGGASGIGLATARRLAARGARVACLDLAPDDLPDPLIGIRADVTGDDTVRAAVEQVVERLGGIDILVNNAGIGALGAVEDNSDEEWHHVFDVNVLGIVRATRAALPHLRRSSHPAIVNTCSFTASAGVPGLALYSSTKGAVLALTRACAADLVATGIRVNCVSPGTVWTPMIAGLLEGTGDPAAQRAALDAHQPIGRLVTADEVAAAIAYLAGPLSGSVTGTDLAVDGGMTALRLRPTTPDRP